MKRSAAPSALLARKKTCVEADVVNDENSDPETEVLGRRATRSGVIDGNSKRPTASETTTKLPSKVYIDITGKTKARKPSKGRRKKEEEEEEEEEELNLKDDDEEEEEEASSRKKEKMEEDGDSWDGEGEEMAAPDKTKENENSFYEVIYYHKKRAGEVETGEGLLVITPAPERMVRLISMDYREIAACKSVMDILPGMAIRMGNKNIEVGDDVDKEEYFSGSWFLKKSRRKTSGGLVGADGEAQVKKLPSWLKTSGPQFTGMKGMKSRVSMFGFRCPFKGSEKPPRDKFEPHFPIDTPNALVLFKPLTKVDMRGKPLVPVVVDPFVGDKLRPHQREGIKFLFDCVTGSRNYDGCGAILADEMGLGKTIQTVALVYTVLRQGKHGDPTINKAIIVAPSSLVKNWCKEFNKWLGPERLRVVGIDGPTNKGKSIINDFELPVERKGADVLVISYDQFRKYADMIYAIAAVDLLVCDEGHRLKNSQIKTTESLNQLKTKRRVILSGTPIQNNLEEFYAMVSFVNPGILGPVNVFKKLYEVPINAGRDPNASEEEKEEGKGRSEELSRATSLFILRRTSSINSSYLPDKVECVVFCKLTDIQLKIYNSIIKMVSKEVESENSTSSAKAKGGRNVGSESTFAAITALKKLCNHPELTYEMCQKEQIGPDIAKAIVKMFPPNFKMGGPVLPELSGKMLVVDQILRDMKRMTDDRIVIVSNYTQTLDILARLCKMRNYGFLRLDGDTTVGKRQGLVDQFNDSKTELVFLLSSKAGGVGLNLVGANRLILFDPDWNPGSDLQAMGRVWRDGQKKRVYIYRMLSTGSIEEKIYQRQVTKQGLSSQLVDEKTTIDSLFAIDDLKALFKLKTETSSDTHDLLFCDCTSKEAKSRRQMFAKKKKSKMEELRSWDHFEDVTGVDDDLLSRSSPDWVSFVFTNFTKGEAVTIAPK